MKTTIAIVCVALSGVSLCRAALVTYSFTGAAGNEVTYAADAQPANGSASVIGRGSGLTAEAAADAFNSSAWTTATSPDANDYYTITITPNGGYLLTLTRIETDERRSATGIRDWAIYSSLDNYTTALATFNVPDDTLTRVNQGVDLSSSFQNLSSSVTFRFLATHPRLAAAHGGWTTWSFMARSTPSLSQ
jgi:hypothetical protein